MRRGSGGQAAIIFILIIALIFLFTAITVNITKVSDTKTTLSNAADAAATNLAAKLGSYSGLLEEKGDSASGWDIGYIVSQIFALAEIIVGLLTLETGGAALIKQGVIQLGVNTGNQILIGLDIVDNNRKLAASGVDLKSQFQEQAIQDALVRVVDDPEMVQDISDWDEDGDTTEYISRFAARYHQRVHDILQDVRDYTGSVLSCIEDFQIPLEAFRDKMVGFKGFLEVELINLLKALKDEGLNVSFWVEGVDWAKMLDDPPVPQNDDIDRLIYIIDKTKGCDEDNFDTFVTTTAKNLDNKALIIGEVFEAWHNKLYDKDADTDDWYSIFGDYSTRMDLWMVELTGISGQLGLINSGLLSQEAKNDALIEALNTLPPVNSPPEPWLAKLAELAGILEQLGLITPVNDYLLNQIAITESVIQVINEILPYLTIGQDPPHMVQPKPWLTALGQIGNNLLSQQANNAALIGRITLAISTLTSAQDPDIQQFMAAVDGLEVGLAGYTGTGEVIAVKYNPVTYSWEDSRGNHHIKVYVQYFNMPRLECDRKWFLGKKTCTVVYEDEPKVCGVEITRFDEGRDTYLWDFIYTKDAEAEGVDPEDPEAALARGIGVTAERNYYCGGTY